jgi:hypothetical protein
MISLPLTNSNKKKEWNLIKTIARNNKFPLHHIDKLHKNIMKQQQNNKTEKKKKKWAIFTYHSPSIKILTNIFKHTNVNIAYRDTNTIAQQIKMRGPNNNNDQNKSGIYKLTCGTCKRAYIGQTSRTLAIRYKEHIRYIRNNQPQSAYTEHILRNKHEYGKLENTMTLIKHINKPSKLIHYEQLIMQQVYRVSQEECARLRESVP